MQNHFKSIIALFSAVIMFSVQGSPLFATNSSQTYKITEIEGKYKTQGRTTVSNGSLILEWSASGIEFNAECEGNVSITVDTNRLSKTGESGGAYFSVLVDGVMQYADKRIPEDNTESNWKSNSTEYPFYINKTGESTFVIAQNLAFGKHKFEIYNQTEAKFASYGIKSITLNGEIIAAPENKDYYIEFVGDSITAGLGNVVKKSPGSPAEIPLYQDATRAWPYLTANKMNADWSVVAVSGIPVCDGIGYYGGISMQTVYPKKRLYSTAEWKSAREPDVVVLGLGTNDIFTYKNKGKDTEYLKNGFEKMLELIKTKNPNAKIVWIYGMMTSGANEIIEEAVKNKRGTENGIYTLALPQNTNGGNGHPELAAQETYANTVFACISRILSDDCTAEGSGVFDFDNGIDLAKSYAYSGKDASNYPVIAKDGDKAVLKMDSKGGKSAARLPFKLEAGKTYSYSISYRVASKDENNVNNTTVLKLVSAGEKDTIDSINNSTHDLVNLLGGWVNLSVNENYESKTGSFTATAANVTADSQYLAIFYFTNGNFSQELYIDKISIYEAIADVTGSYTFDFNNPSELQAAATYETIPKITDDNGKKVVSMEAAGSKSQIQLPFILEADKTYYYSVKYRVISQTSENVYTNMQLHSAAKVVGEIKSSEIIDRKHLLNKTIDWKHLGTGITYNTVSGTFTTDSSNVNETSNYLTILYETNGNAQQTIYIDSITVEMCNNVISFNAGDVTVSPIENLREGMVVALPLPEKDGYYFDGWYTDENYSNKVGLTYTVTAESNVTLYGRWEEKANVEAPTIPEIISHTQDSVTLKATVGYEYSMDKSVWQISPEFTGLFTGVKYEFYQRVAETKTAKASPASEAAVLTITAYGDANADGSINAVDLAIIRKILLGVTVEHNADGVNANGDNITDIRDLVHVKKIISSR